MIVNIFKKKMMRKREKKLSIQKIWPTKEQENRKKKDAAFVFVRFFSFFIQNTDNNKERYNQFFRSKFQNSKSKIDDKH